ncbi:amino acid decarboxylase [Clostridium sp. W14A]|nr:amino acid decarboxylase [Clostridium sp. W14A]
MSAPLYSALKNHAALGRASFHTPGHKSSPAALPGGLFQLDLTELPDTGSLYDGGGPIEQAEALASKLFGTARTCLSAGGCTLCVQAMFRLAAPNGGKVVCCRKVHRSAVGAMALLGIEPVWAMPEELVPAVGACEDAKAVYVTSPDYYGRLLDIPAISAACRKKGIPLLVDNAHGAHLMFTEPKLHPLLLGASMTADSAHKTLGVLTGGAWLQIGDSRFSAGAKDAMALFGSTSPSFPVLASLDLCRERLETHAGAFRLLQERARRVRRLALSRGIPSPSGSADPTRLTLQTAKIGLTGTRAAELFRAAGIEPEYADRSFVVFIATPFNTEEDFQRLERAVRSLPAAEPLPEVPEMPPFSPACVPLREALLAESRTVPLERAVGGVAAQIACPCPPGIPAVMPGERVTKETAEFLCGYGFLEIKVLK